MIFGLLISCWKPLESSKYLIYEGYISKCSCISYELASDRFWDKISIALPIQCIRNLDIIYLYQDWLGIKGYYIGLRCWKRVLWV